MFEYRVRYKRDKRWYEKRFVHLAAAERRAKWLNNEESLHWRCDDYETYHTNHLCLSELDVPAVIQKREVGKWEDEALSN